MTDFKRGDRVWVKSWVKGDEYRESVGTYLETDGYGNYFCEYLTNGISTGSKWFQPDHVIPYDAKPEPVSESVLTAAEKEHLARLQDPTYRWSERLWSRFLKPTPGPEEGRPLKTSTELPEKARDLAEKKFLFDYRPIAEAWRQEIQGMFDYGKIRKSGYGPSYPDQENFSVQKIESGLCQDGYYGQLDDAWLDEEEDKDTHIEGGHVVTTLDGIKQITFFAGQQYDWHSAYQSRVPVTYKGEKYELTSWFTNDGFKTVTYRMLPYRGEG